MTVLCLASATGAPGVTSTAVGLTMFWPRDVLLVDTDRDAGQAVLAGFLQGADAGGRGLGAFAQSHRERRSVNLLDQGFQLIEDPNTRRMFVPGFPHPGAAGLFAQVWVELAAAISDVSSGFDVLIDAGRVGRELPEPIVATADQLLLVVRSQLRAVAAMGAVVDAVRERCLLHDTKLGLMVVGPQRPYDSADISRQFGVPVVATLPWDPAAAEFLSDGEAVRRFERTPLARAFADTALALTQTQALGRAS